VKPDTTEEIYVSATLSSCSGRLNSKTLESTVGGNLLLQFSHTLLVTGGIGRVRFQGPGKVAVNVVGLEAGIEDTETLAVVGDLLPVTLDVLQVTAEVGVGALENLAVDGGSHDGLHVNVFLVGASGVGNDGVGGTLDGAHELVDLVLVGGQERVVGNVQDRAEAAAAQLGQLVDTEHLNVVAGTALLSQPLGQLDHLHVLEADTGVDVTADDGLGHIHAAAHSGVIIGSHAVVLGELINLDLAELANVADALALQAVEVFSDAAALQVDDTGEGLVEQRAN